MIAKRVKRIANSNYGRLAEYIAAASDPGEKLEDLWIVNSNGGEGIEDLSHAIRDIEATQALNFRSKADKTYHLIVSFRDEKPSPDQLREIELNFAKALGFENHQRVVGTHQNTDNFHMHIAYNKVHPETLVLHTPYKDFYKLSETCRKLEQSFDLKVDPGIEKGDDYKRVNQAAKDYEAHTWQQSLDGYVKEHAKELKEAVDKAKSWQDLHTRFAEYGLELRPRGNGMIIKSLTSKQMVKASTLDRTIAASTKKRLGPYVVPDKSKSQKFKIIYQAKPITKHKATPKLWKRFKSKQSLLSTDMHSWKEFLKLEAINDPLALAIIMAQKQMVNMVVPKISRRQRH